MVKAIADKAKLAARLRSVLGDRTVAELQAPKAENRIVGIKAQLGYDQKILVAKEMDIERDHLVIGDHLFFQAGREAVSWILKGDEFTVLQQSAEENIAGLRYELAGDSRLTEQAKAIFVGAPAEGNRMSRKKEIGFDLDRLVRPPADPCIVRLADVGLPARRELSWQSGKGPVCGCGQIVVDGKLIKEDGLFAVERTAAVSKLIEAGVLLDQGFEIPSGWINTADGRIMKA